MKRPSPAARHHVLATATMALCWGLLIGSAAYAAKPKPANKALTKTARTTTKALEKQTARDLNEALRFRRGLQSIIAFTDTRTELFGKSATKPKLLSRDGRKLLLDTWTRLLDFHLGLERLSEFYRGFYKLSGTQRRLALRVHYTAFVAQYRFAMAFIERVERNPWLHPILDEEAPQHHLPGGTYSAFKLRYLNVAHAAQFGTLAAMWKLLKPPVAAPTRAAIAADVKHIWAMGKGKGEALTLKNGLKILQKSTMTAWLPLQAGVAEWMGDTKVLRQHSFLITPAQIAELTAVLQPGDIMVNRREWYLSNVGLPGFWPHATLFIGTAADRRAFFADEAVRKWVKSQGQADGDLEALLKRSFPDAYRLSLLPQEHGHIPRVIEAISEGVSLTTMEHSADADALAALRPKASKVAAARAIFRAFRYVGRPYDFDFDFRTDAELVCTELVYKAYEPTRDVPGLRFATETMMNRPVLPANLIVKQFDRDFGTAKQQLDLLVFLDGRERDKRAVRADLTAFRASWKRPKWHIFLQNPGSVERAEAQTRSKR